jgi:hypothetical protein
VDHFKIVDQSTVMRINSVKSIIAEKLLKNLSCAQLIVISLMLSIIDYDFADL